MKLFAKILSENEIHLTRQELSPDDDWYEVEREWDPGAETIRFDADKNLFLVETRAKTAKETTAEQKSTEDSALMKADTIRDLQAEIAALKLRLAALESPKEP